MKMSKKLALALVASFIVLGGCATGPRPVAHWGLDNGSGDTAVDRVGGHNGKLVEGPTWTSEGRVRGALEFDGSDDMVVTEFAPQMDGDTAFTIAAWIKTDKSIGAIFGRTAKNQPDWPAGSKVFFISSQGRLRYDVGFVSGVDGKSKVADGQWHHVAVTKEGNAYTFYVDGEADGGGNLDMSHSSAPDIEGHVVILGLVEERGQTDDPDAFKGTMDDVRFYDRVLTPEEIKALCR
jgi:hypothetical protein